MFARFFSRWDRASVIAFLLAIGLLVVTLFLAAFSLDLRTPALVGAGGLFIIAQLIFMWGNRWMVTPYKKAQTAFSEGDFATARGILESLRATGKVDAEVFTLLGNTYRQLGMLDESEAVLREALRLRPSHYFPLYGFGRTLLAKGNYAEAARAVKKALDSGAPSVVQFDLGEIYFRQGLTDEAVTLLREIRPTLHEPYRLLMTDYLLFRLGDGEPPAPELVLEGLPYWYASAQRFGATPYGQTLLEDIHGMQTLEEEQTQ